MDARSKEVGDLRCPERGFSAPSNQTAPSDQAADAPVDAFRALPDAPGGAFRALPANGAAANAACRHDAMALVEHGRSSRQTRARPGLLPTAQLQAGRAGTPPGWHCSAPSLFWAASSASGHPCSGLQRPGTGTGRRQRVLPVAAQPRQALARTHLGGLPHCWRHLAATKGSRSAPHGRGICIPPRHARPA